MKEINCSETSRHIFLTLRHLQEESDLHFTHFESIRSQKSYMLVV